MREKKRFERALAIDAAKALSDAIDGYYYDDYPESEQRVRYKLLYRAQTAFNSAALGYFLGVYRTSIPARLKRRAARRKQAAERRLVA